MCCILCDLPYISRARNFKRHSMRTFLFFIMGCFICSTTALGKDGYRVELEFTKDIDDAYVYMAHYFGKSMPTIYRIDSAKVVDKRKASFRKHGQVLGGIYLFIYNGNSRYSEFLLDNGAAFQVKIDNRTAESPEPDKVYFKNSKENEVFQEYNEGLAPYNKAYAKAMKQLSVAANGQDSAQQKKALMALRSDQEQFKREFVAKRPNAFLSKVIKASLLPEIPKGWETETEEGRERAMEYQRDHYWDDYDLKDDRLMNTPIYDNKLTDYFDHWLYPIPDTLKKHADILLSKSEGTQEVYRYTLRTLANGALTSKVMGMDDFFIHLVEEYYLKGKAPWLDSAGIAWYAAEARKFKPNVIGNKAPDLQLQDIYTMKDLPLDQVSAPFVLLIFWSYDCGVCKKEVPELKKLYDASLKAKGVKVYSVGSGKELDGIRQFVKENDLEEWANVADLYGKSNYKDKYDAYATPRVYLLDKNKKIVGKRLGHENVLELIEWLEKKAS